MWGGRFRATLNLPPSLKRARAAASGGRGRQNGGRGGGGSRNGVRGGRNRVRRGRKRPRRNGRAAEGSRRPRHGGLQRVGPHRGLGRRGRDSPQHRHRQSLPMAAPGAAEPEIGGGRGPVPMATGPGIPLREGKRDEGRDVILFPIPGTLRVKRPLSVRIYFHRIGIPAGIAECFAFPGFGDLSWGQGFAFPSRSVPYSP